jgi:copper transport protein
MTRVTSPPDRLLRALLLLLAALLAVSVIGSVRAHAELAGAEPAPSASIAQAPDQLRLQFTEPIEPGFSSIQVLDAQGGRRDQGDLIWDPAVPARAAVALAPLEEGVYTVSWRVLSSVDGHVTYGVFAFAVGVEITPGEVAAPEPGPSLLGAALQGLIALGALVVAGAFIFHLLVLRPAFANVGPEALTAVSQRTVLLLGVALAVLGVANLVFLLYKTVEVAGVPWTQAVGPSTLDLLTNTRLGLIWTLRMAIIGVVAAIVFLPGTVGAPEEDVRGKRFFDLGGLLFSVALLGTITATSHAAAGDLQALAVPTDFLHLLAASAWVGGLVSLAVVGLPSAASPDAQEAVRRALIPRFSLVALVSFGVLGLTGLVSGWLRVGGPAPLTGTVYGLALVAKLALVVALAGVAAVNLFYTRPRLAKGVDDAFALLRRLVRVEVFLGVLIVAAVGVLTVTPPAREAWARMPHPLVLTESMDDLHVRLEVAPAQIGPNSYEVALEDDRGRSVAGATVEATFDFLGADLGEQAVRFTEEGEGRYVAQGAELSLRGPWEVLVLVRRVGAFDAQVPFRFQVPSGGVQAEPRLPQLQPTLGGWTIVGLEIITVGLILAAIGWRLRGAGAALSRGVIVAGAVVALIGGALSASSQFVSPEEADVIAARNPFPPTEESLATGRAIFQERCVVCHGAGGRGDGPMAPELDPPPLDLTVHVPLHPEGQVYQYIAEGMPGTAMPAFEGDLTDEQVWHLVNYLEALARDGAVADLLPAPLRTPASPP